MQLKIMLGKFQCQIDNFFTNNYFKKEIFPGYTKIIEKKSFEIYKANEIKEVIVAAFQSVVVTRKLHKKEEYLNIYPIFSKRILKYKIKFNYKNFPNLIPGSKIMNCLILPYMREVEKGIWYKRWRLIIFTDKCQIYHNFPSRGEENDSYELFGDIKRFEESVVWDIPKRKYPSKNKNCHEVESYFPFLPEDCYLYYPRINEKSKYGNFGFDKFTRIRLKNGELKKVSRFYFPNRVLKANPFAYMGGIDLDYKMSLIGTYQSNKNIGVRTCIFATSDGGRSWFNKFEFSDEGTYTFKQGRDDWGCNFGNPINGENYEDYYNEVIIKRRDLIHDENGDTQTFTEMAKIEKIFAEKIVKIRTKTKHGLMTGNIVVMTNKNKNNCEGIELLFDTGDNTKLYKVKVIDDRNFLLYENVSNPFVSIACRHIHHINRIRDGWLVGTGEVYPNGWLIYLQMREADTYTNITAADEISWIKLNNSSTSIQRTMGADLIDGENPKIIFASDHDLLPRPRYKLKNLQNIDRNSTGIYLGYLEDINNFNQFYPIYEAKEPAYYFKKMENRYVFSGQRGEIAISDDSYKVWESCHIDNPLIRFRGSTYRFHVIDKYLLVLK